MVSIFASSLDVQLESQSTSAVAQDGRFLLLRFYYDIQNAGSISIPASPGVTSNSLQINVGGINYTYSTVFGNIQLTNNNGTDTLNSFDTTISNVSFQRLADATGKDNIKILFTVTSKSLRTGISEAKTFQTTVGLR